MITTTPTARATMSGIAAQVLKIGIIDRKILENLLGVVTKAIAMDITVRSTASIAMSTEGTYLLSNLRRAGHRYFATYSSRKQDHMVRSMPVGSMPIPHEYPPHP